MGIHRRHFSLSVYHYVITRSNPASQSNFKTCNAPMPCKTKQMNFSLTHLQNPSLLVISGSSFFRPLCFWALFRNDCLFDHSRTVCIPANCLFCIPEQGTGGRIHHGKRDMDQWAGGTPVLVQVRPVHLCLIARYGRAQFPDRVIRGAPAEEMAVVRLPDIHEVPGRERAVDDW